MGRPAHRGGGGGGSPECGFPAEVRGGGGGAQVAEGLSLACGRRHLKQQSRRRRNSAGLAWPCVQRRRAQSETSAASESEVLLVRSGLRCWVWRASEGAERGRSNLQWTAESRH